MKPLLLLLLVPLMMGLADVPVAMDLLFFALVLSGAYARSH